MIKLSLILLIGATAFSFCLAGQQPTDKNTKTVLRAECPKCEIVVTNTVKAKDIRCNGGRSVTNGVISEYTAKMVCPLCKTKFDTQFEQFHKAVPKAEVVK